MYIYIYNAAKRIEQIQRQIKSEQWFFKWYSIRTYRLCRGKINRFAQIQIKKFRKCLLQKVGRVAQSVQRLTTGWTVRGSNPGGGEIFRTRPDRP
jgi:hypothetical protein